MRYKYEYIFLVPDRKHLHNQDNSSSQPGPQIQWMYRFILNKKTIENYFINIDNPILSTYRQHERHKIARVYWKRTRTRMGLMLTDFKTYKATVIKTVLYWQKNRQKIDPQRPTRRLPFYLKYLLSRLLFIEAQQFTNWHLQWAHFDWIHLDLSRSILWNWSYGQLKGGNCR